VSASGISFNADDETGEIGPIVLRQVDHGVGAALPQVNEVVGIEDVPLLVPLTIRQGCVRRTFSRLRRTSFPASPLKTLLFRSQARSHRPSPLAASRIKCGVFARGGRCQRTSPSWGRFFCQSSITLILETMRTSSVEARSIPSPQGFEKCTEPYSPSQVPLHSCSSQLYRLRRFLLDQWSPHQTNRR
jgi:hypothetical protein